MPDGHETGIYIRDLDSPGQMFIHELNLWCYDMCQADPNSSSTPYIKKEIKRVSWKLNTK